MPKTTATFFAPDRARQQAQLLGFASEPIVLSKDLYQWIDTTLPLRKLTLNITTLHFTLTYDVAGDINLLKEKNLPDKANSQQEGQSLISSYNLSHPDLKYPPNTQFLKWSQNQFIPVESLTQANFVQLTFGRADSVTEPFVYSKNQAPIKIILSGSSNNLKKIVLLEYLYKFIDYEIYASYPLKTVKQALEELKQKNAYFNNYLADSATVRNVYLAYYEELNQQTYIQPVFVFTGDNDFTAYVPAIKNDWVKEN